VARKRKKKSEFERIVISIATFLCLIMGLVKILFDTFSWLSVFAPIIVAFILVFCVKVLKSSLKRL
jgi:Mn2+/Fe2+ NRAMP family transporter